MMVDLTVLHGSDETRRTVLKQLSDEDLVLAHLDSVPGAFRELYKRYRPRLLSFIRRKTGDPDRAHDLVQETFVRVAKHLHRFDADRTFSTWIFTIAANLTKNEHRNRKRSPLVLFQSLEWNRDQSDRPLEFADNGPGPDDLYRRRQLRIWVSEAMEEMKPKHRLVFRLREMEGKSYREISRMTGVSMGTVKSRMHRARHEFKELIRTLLPT